jgi:hypothetical protein
LDDSKFIDDDKKNKEKPTVPVFNKEEFLKKWLEDNPVIEIPAATEPENDADWVLTEEEEQAMITNYLSGKDSS